MKQLLTTVILSALLITSCSKKVEEPKPIPVKAQWTISNMGYLLKWNAQVTIDKPLDEDVTITVEFIEYPTNTPVSVSFLLPKGWTYWYGTSSVAPASYSTNAKPGSVTLSIKGTKQYTITY
jgi:hypothetical protein